MTVIDAESAEAVPDGACDLCGWAPPEGDRRPLPLAVGAHKRNVHGIAGKKRNPGQSDEPAHPVRAAIGEVASELGAGRGRKTAPKAEELAQAGGKAITIITTAAASYLAETDERLPDTPEGDAERDAIVDRLAVPQKAGAAIMRPVGRAVAPTKINTRFGRQIVDNVDLVESASEVVTALIEWRRYLRERRRGTATAAVAPVIPMVPPTPSESAEAPPAAPPTNGSAPPPMPPPAGAPVATTPGPTRGVIVTPEMVQSMSRAR